MKHVLCSAFDSAARCFGQPMYVPAVGVALRSFRSECERVDPTNALYAHADDFELFELGTFDDNTGQFELLPQPRLVARAKDLSPKAIEKPAQAG